VSDEHVQAVIDLNAFLASEALSAYVVGQIVEVNGGQLMP
jgi:NAD(P)-dependent dehydrogenase (short-subunit alcohol dehydrogenase family)